MTSLPNFRKQNKNVSTITIHTGNRNKSKYGELVPPISVTSIYELSVPPKDSDYSYQRENGPSQGYLQECLAALEETKHCLVVSSGMAAFNLIFQTLTKPGDQIVTQTDHYFGVFHHFKNLRENGVIVESVDMCDMSKLELVLRPETKLVFIETPTNPLLKVVDIAAVVSTVRKIAKNAFICADNTFITPCFQRPVEFGVDIIMHSCSKYIGGHSDIIMGCVCYNDDILHEKFFDKRSMLGSMPSGITCHMVQRSLKTLEARMKIHMESGLAVARMLETHPAVIKVHHPGLHNHPHHEIALRQSYGHSGIFSFELKGNVDDAYKFAKALKLVLFADSLGGVETTLKLPYLYSSKILSDELLKGQGVTPTLIRISVGIENTEDILRDLEQALNKLM